MKLIFTLTIVALFLSSCVVEEIYAPDDIATVPTEPNTPTTPDKLVVNGTVLDYCTGKPVRGVTAQIRTCSSCSSGIGLKYTKTDTEGYFEMSIPNNDWCTFSLCSNVALLGDKVPFIRYASIDLPVGNDTGTYYLYPFHYLHLEISPELENQQTEFVELEFEPVGVYTGYQATPELNNELVNDGSTYRALIKTTAGSVHKLTYKFRKNGQEYTEVRAFNTPCVVGVSDLTISY